MVHFPGVGSAFNGSDALRQEVVRTEARGKLKAGRAELSRR